MYCVIMAGGSGTRFWPRSREDHSKQFLNILGKQSLIQATISRFQKFIDSDKIFIVSKQSQHQDLKDHAPDFADDHFIFEPEGKNTAPAIGLAALTVRRLDPEAVMVVSPADHLIQKEGIFKRSINSAAKCASEMEGMVTIGIPPSRPATGYGYIQVADRVGSYDRVRAYNVRTFAEKPNPATAERFLKSGDFYWNSGLFIFKVSMFFDALKTHLRDLYNRLSEIDAHHGKATYNDVLRREYNQMKDISIDYGIMEKLGNVFLIKGNFTWSDLGSWEQVYKLSPKDGNGNSVSGDALLLDTQNSYIYSSKGFIATIGMEDVAVIQDGKTVLVCRIDQAEEVKQLVQTMKKKKMKKSI